jgi:hypothetical protein
MSSNKFPAGTLNLVQIQNAIYDWVYSVLGGVLDSGEQIIWRDQSQPLPQRPCVTLKFIHGPAPIGRDGSVFFNPATGAYNVGMQMEATLSVQIFGNTNMNQMPIVHQLAIDLNSSLLRQTVKDKLKSGGVSIQTVGHPQNLSALEESRYEERAGFEIGLGLVQNIGDAPGTIGIINLEQTVDEETTDKTITLP